MNNKQLTIMVAGVLAGLLATGSVQAHQGMPNVSARDACVKQSLGAACEWSDSHSARYIGSCRKVSTSLLCVRNKPIVHSKTHAKTHLKTDAKHGHPSSPSVESKPAR